jgi:DNA-binding NtrC family response regulator
MSVTVFVINPYNDDRVWIAAALASTAYAVEFVDDGAALFARLLAEQPACLVAFAEPDAGVALQLVREVRQCAPALPVIVLGPHSAFRTAVDIARLPATDFLERPVSSRQLRLAIAKALKGHAPIGGNRC